MSTPRFNVEDFADKLLKDSKLGQVPADKIEEALKNIFGEGNVVGGSISSDELALLTKMIGKAAVGYSRLEDYPHTLRDECVKDGGWRCHVDHVPGEASGDKPDGDKTLGLTFFKNGVQVEFCLIDIVKFVTIVLLLQAIARHDDLKEEGGAEAVKEDFFTERLIKTAMDLCELVVQAEDNREFQESLTDKEREVLKRSSDNGFGALLRQLLKGRSQK